MMNVPVIFLIIYVSCVCLLAIVGYYENSNETLVYEIVEYNTPKITPTPNGSSVFITGTLRDNSEHEFSNVTVNFAGIGEHGQVVDSENIEIPHMSSYSNVEYNVSLENDSTVVAGQIQVLNAKIIS
jgi:hypothetical protein